MLKTSMKNNITVQMESENNDSSLHTIVKLVTEVRKNYADLLQEWCSLQRDLRDNPSKTFKRTEKNQVCGGTKETVVVKKNDLSLLATEIAQLKQNIPKVLNKNVTTAWSRVQVLEEENEKLRQHCIQLTQQTEEANFKYEKAIADTQAEKQECLKLRCEIQALNQQLTQQSDYCTGLGSSCCTLLWRVSQQENSIQAILSGTKVDEFLSLVSSTLQSFLSAYKHDWPSEELEESQFILALCGVITNIAASAYGRDFLITNHQGKEVLDTYTQLLSEAPVGKSARLKSLLVMALYNISINLKGLKYLSSMSGLLSLSAWLVQVELDSDLRLNCLRLIQSLVLNEANLGVIHEFNEMLPQPVLEELSRDKHKDVREMALELITDLQQLQQQQGQMTYEL